MRYVPGRCLLHQLLEERKQSQVWLSEQTGISPKKISDYANRRAIMRLDNAKTIATVLKVPIEKLYEWDVDMSR